MRFRAVAFLVLAGLVFGASLTAQDPCSTPAELYSKVEGFRFVGRWSGCSNFLTPLLEQRHNCIAGEPIDFIARPKTGERFATCAQFEWTLQAGGAQSTPKLVTLDSFLTASYPVDYSFGQSERLVRLSAQNWPNGGMYAEASVTLRTSIPECEAAPAPSAEVVPLRVVWGSNNCHSLQEPAVPCDIKVPIFFSVSERYSHCYSVLWDFGDGVSREGRIVAHQYDRVGRFFGSVTISNSKGEVSVPIRVQTIDNGYPFSYRCWGPEILNPRTEREAPLGRSITLELDEVWGSLPIETRWYVQGNPEPIGSGPTLVTPPIQEKTSFVARVWNECSMTEHLFEVTPGPLRRRPLRR